MARPSQKTEKTEHILRAYERCVALYGVEGATLQKVAEEADMARPLLRHYVGNQEDLLEQCVARYFARQEAQRAAYKYIETANELLEGLFDGLFDGLLDELQDADDATQTKQSSATSNDAASENDIMIASAFTLAASTHPVIKQKMQQWFVQVQKDMQKTLSRLYPEAEKQTVADVSTGIIGIYFNLYAMQPIEQSQQFIRHSRSACELLLNTLNTQS